MFVVTGATGHLGRLVIEELLKITEPRSIVAAVRSVEKASELAQRGVVVRQADYTRPESLAAAFRDVSRLLLVSGTDLGQRVPQHRAVIDAAKTSSAQFVAYTSILRCAESPLLLAEEHRATEQYLLASGLGYSLLRNGWYFENQTAAIPAALQHGAFIGASGEGRFAAASRADYAAAAAAVLTRVEYDNSTLELAGDISYTRAELASEVSRQASKNVIYRDLSQAEYSAALRAFLPAAISDSIADAESHAANGWLDDTSHTLSRIIGRPTSTLADAVRRALQSPSTTH